ncbi:hypothetical protein ACWEQG_38780, partial [Microbispora sp. NPDC004025]
MPRRILARTVRPDMLWMTAARTALPQWEVMRAWKSWSRAMRLLVVDGVCRGDRLGVVEQVAQVGPHVSLPSGGHQGSGGSGPARGSGGNGDAGLSPQVTSHDLAFGTSRWSSKLIHGG